MGQPHVGDAGPVHAPVGAVGPICADRAQDCDHRGHILGRSGDHARARRPPAPRLGGDAPGGVDGRRVLACPAADVHLSVRGRPDLASPARLGAPPRPAGAGAGAGGALGEPSRGVHDGVPRHRPDRPGDRVAGARGPRAPPGGLARGRAHRAARADGGGREPAESIRGARDPVPARGRAERALHDLDHRVVPAELPPPELPGARADAAAPVPRLRVGPEPPRRGRRRAGPRLREPRAHLGPARPPVRHRGRADPRGRAAGGPRADAPHRLGGHPGRRAATPALAGAGADRAGQRRWWPAPPCS